jgi:hypothetical protein
MTTDANGGWRQAAEQYMRHDTGKSWLQDMADFGQLVAEVTREHDAKLLDSFAAQLLRGLPDLGGSHNAKEYARAIRSETTEDELLAAISEKLEG